MGSRFPGTCFIFVVGLLEENGINQIRFKKERRAHQHILQIDHAESYANVVYKEVAVLQWSRHFYREIPHLFKTDADLIVDALLLSSIARFLLTNQTESASYIAKHRPALLSKLSNANRNHLFCGGWTIKESFLSMQQCGRIVLSRRTVPVSVSQRLDDVSTESNSLDSHLGLIL